MIAEYPTSGRYRLKLVEVDGFRYLRENEPPAWFTEYIRCWPRRVVVLEAGKMDVRCREGWRMLEYGMWVVMRPTGHLSVIDPGAFEVAYEPIPAGPKNHLRGVSNV